MRLMLKPFGLSSKVVFDDPDGLPTAPLQRLGCCSPHGAFPVMTMSFGMFRFRNDPALRHFRLRNAGATRLLLTMAILAGTDPNAYDVGWPLPLEP